jgi:hypothetical protein
MIINDYRGFCDGALGDIPTPNVHNSLGVRSRQSLHFGGPEGACLAPKILGPEVFGPHARAASMEHNH